jgi:D-xylose transport system permease protein
VSAEAATIDAAPPSNSLGAIARRRWDALKAGDVGTLPIIVGLAGIVVFFHFKNENFLSAGNFTNLMTQMAGVTTIAIGVVFVLLLGEIDLSIAYVSGVAGVIVAQLQIPDGSWEVKGVFAIAIAVSITALIGALQGSFVAFIGVPSFVVTLAGLLFWQGVILYRIGEQGVIIIEDNRINDVANYFFTDRAGLLIAAIASGLYALTTLMGVVGRRRHGIRSDNLLLVVAKILFVSAVVFGAVIWANQERGFPLAMVIVLVFLVFWTWVAERTTFGRHVYAVGGNAEAARRAGIRSRASASTSS